MKFKLDENLPVDLVSDLRQAGHDADSVPDEGLTGAPRSHGCGCSTPGTPYPVDTR